MRPPGFPRLYAAASLKPATCRDAGGSDHRFSAALCRGLIEALDRPGAPSTGLTVFRGFMPRPH